MNPGVRDAARRSGGPREKGEGERPMLHRSDRATNMVVRFDLDLAGEHAEEPESVAESLANLDSLRFGDSAS
jgi:hypothetical protein